MGRLTVVAALWLIAWLALAPAVAAHPGHPAGRRQTVVQAVGPYLVQLAIELPPGTSGPLYVDVVPESLPSDALLTLAAVPFGATAEPQVSLPLTAGTVGPFYARQLAVDGAGAWELLVGATGAAGTGNARIPFTVAAPVPTTADLLMRGSLAVLVVLMVAGTGLVAVGPRQADRLPRWVPWAIAVGIAGSAAVAGATSARQVLVPPPAPAASMGSTAAGRPHVNVLLRAEPARPRPGDATAITLDVVDGSTGRPVDDLVLHHEALMHAVVVSDDGGFFAHLHPARVAPGRFTIAFTPDRSGPFTFYADVTRDGGGTQVVARPLLVGGDQPGPPPVDRSPVGRVEVGDLEVEGQATAAPIRAGEPTTLTFRVLRDGRPVDGLEPWLGMAGHLIARSADGAVFAHVHATGQPLAAPADVGAAGAFGVLAEPAAGPVRFGPEIQLSYTFPQAGTYQVWLQFKHDGTVSTVPYAVVVEPAA